MRVFENYIKELERDAWKSDTATTFEEAGKEMIAAGMEPQNVVDILESLRAAVGNEYGD
jgi:hypothetical protein